VTYPNDSLQYNIDDTWWEEDKSVEPKRGSLLWVYCCAIEPKPAILTPTSRSTPTNHTIAQAEIKTINSFEDIKNQTKLPIAGLPIRDKEFYFVFRAKMRPALVLSEPNQKLENIPGDTSKYIKQRTLLVAPYYGTEQNGARAGWPPPLVQRIKNCVYPQFMWEILPAKKSPFVRHALTRWYVGKGATLGAGRDARPRDARGAAAGDHGAEGLHDGGL
jgi:hypothetical protein